MAIQNILHVELYFLSMHVQPHQCCKDVHLESTSDHVAMSSFKRHIQQKEFRRRRQRRLSSTQLLHKTPKIINFNASFKHVIVFYVQEIIWLFGYL